MPLQCPGAPSRKCWYVRCKYVNLRFWASGGYRNLWSGQLVLQLILQRA